MSRSHVFGPYLQANPDYFYEVYWTPLASVSQGIAGLFLDSDGNIGATHDGLSGRPPNARPPPLPESDAEPECILTTASLRGVRCVSAQMCPGEAATQLCSGMLLEYWDGSASALGRWNPRGEGGMLQVVRVFDADGVGAPLGGLAFRDSGPDEAARVVEVEGFARGEGGLFGDDWAVFDAAKGEVRNPPPCPSAPCYPSPWEVSSSLTTYPWRPITHRCVSRVYCVN